MIPQLREWQDRFADRGLVVVAVHTPANNNEKNIDTLTAMVDDLVISYPVVADNTRRTWMAYHNRFWPAIYLVDKAGTIRFSKVGPGQEAAVEECLLALLGE